MSVVVMLVVMMIEVRMLVWSYVMWSKIIVFNPILAGRGHQMTTPSNFEAYCSEMMLIPKNICFILGEEQTCQS